MGNLKEQVAKLLDEMEFSYDINEGKHLFYFDVATKRADVSVNICYDEESQCLYNLSCLTFNLPEECKAALLCKINEIHNSSLSAAHLYLDNDGNRLSAQAVIDVPKGGVDKDVFGYFLCAPGNMLDEYFDEIMKVAFGHGEADIQAAKADGAVADADATGCNDGERPS